MLPETGQKHSPPSRGLLRAKAEAARTLLRRCNFCEMRCGTDRLVGPGGRCGLGEDSWIYKQYVSLNEEPELKPAWRVFLGGCNFRCPYCDEAPDAFRTSDGRLAAPAQWATELGEMLNRGIRVVSLLGGEPSLHVHTILSLTAESPMPLPIALNTNMYMTPEVIELLDGLVAYYLADFKFGNDVCAWRIAGASRYSETIRRNLRLVSGKSGVIIRHLLLPGHLDCCFRPVADWVAKHQPGTRFQLYPGYVPCGDPGRIGSLGRLNSPEDVRQASDYLNSLPLRSEMSTLPGNTAVRQGGDPWGSVGLTVGVDGRVYCHDLTPELANALTAACSGERGMPHQPDHLGTRLREKT